MPERAPGRQILGIIQGAGLKGEELKWSGIGPALDRLAAEHQDKIPKAAVLDYLRNDGAVRLEEVTLDTRIEPSADLAEWLDKHTTRLPSTLEEWIERANDLEATGRQWQRNDNQEAAEHFFDLSDEARRYAEGLGETRSTRGMPKFSSWQEPVR